MGLGWILIQFAVGFGITQEGFQFFIILTTVQYNTATALVRWEEVDVVILLKIA